MGSKRQDDYQDGESRVHIIALLAAVFALTTSSLLFQNPLILFILLVISMVLYLVPRPSGEEFWKMTILIKRLLPLILCLFVLQVLFVSGGKEMFRWWIFSVSSNGLQSAVSVSVRLLLILILAGTLLRQNLNDYRIAFRMMRLPEEVVVMVMITFSFLLLLVSKFALCREQLKLRGIDMRKVAPGKRIGMYVDLIMPVLGRTLQAAKYQAIALDLRGFRNGRKHTMYRRKSLKTIDYGVIIMSLLLPGIIYLLSLR